MAKRSAAQRFFQELMDEHVIMPGCPQLVVTRGFVYSFLTDKLGYDKSERGFGSVDYLTFRREAVNAPLSDLTQYEGLFAMMIRDCAR